MVATNRTVRVQRAMHFQGQMLQDFLSWMHLQQIAGRVKFDIKRESSRTQWIGVDPAVAAHPNISFDSSSWCLDANCTLAVEDERPFEARRQPDSGL